MKMNIKNEKIFSPEEFKKITDTEITDTIDKTFNKSFEFIDNLGKKEDVKNKDNNN